MRFFAIIFAMLFSATAFSQEDAISKYFSKYVDDDRFTVVYVSGKMFEIINKMELDFDDEEAEAVLSVVKDLQGLRILTTEEDGLKFYNEAVSIINTKDYETLMTVREGKSEHVQFLVKDSNNGEVIDELLLLVGGDGEDFVLVSFIGQIDLNEVGKLAKAFEDDIHHEHQDGEDHEHGQEKKY